MSSSTESTKVWFITGCSSGFGREIALAALKRGDLVIATARRLSELDELKTLGCDVLPLDVTADDDAIKKVVAEAHALHGRIDILVNNAGRVILGGVEESSANDVEGLFKTNVFGLLAVTRAVLPYMRARRSGTIANIGSVTGHRAHPANGVYAATKFAVAALSEALRKENAHLGIDVVVIEPGFFVTDIFTKQDPKAEYTIPELAPAFAEVNQIYELAISGKIGGSAAKGAKAIVEVLTLTGQAAGRKLPGRLPLGDVFEIVEGSLKGNLQELYEWADFTKPELFAFDS